jgi:hypothetical protein
MTTEILDGTGTIFFQRELEQVKARAYDVLYSDLTYTKAFDVSNEINPGAETITYETYDQRGAAKIIKGNANDIPRADVDGKETTINVVTLASMFAYTVQEIKAAQYAGKNLSQRRANAARRALEEKMNYLTWFGDATANLQGFFTSGLITSAQAAATGTASSRAWADKTGALIFADVNGVISTVVEGSEGVEVPNMIGLPIAQYNLIMSTNMGTGTDTTVAQYIVNNSPYLNSIDQFMAIPDLNLATGSGSTDAMIVWTKSPDKVQIEIPEDVNFMPPQLVGLEYQVIGQCRFGGLNYYYPKSAYVLTDI